MLDLSQVKPEEKAVPGPEKCIKLIWDDESQGVAVQFNAAEFKTWDFVLGILEMARMKAEFAKRMTEMQNIQALHQQVNHDQRIRRQLGM
jgi:hypothetical protein